MAEMEVMQEWREEFQCSWKTRANVDAHNENVDSVRCVVLMASLVFPFSKLTIIIFRPP